MFQLILLVLAKFRVDSTDLILIAPFWPKRPLVLNSSEFISEVSLEIVGQKWFAEAGIFLSPRPNIPQSDSLVSEEDLLRRRGLSEKLINSLLTSRIKVTRALYFKGWKCYNWCSGKNFDSRSTISVLEFLHDGMEKGLAVSTFKAQVAALSVSSENFI